LSLLEFFGKVTTAFIVVSSFFNATPINRSSRPAQIKEEDFNSINSNSMLTESIMMIPLSAGGLFIAGCGCYFATKDLLPMGDLFSSDSLFLSAVVISNKNFSRLKNKIENSRKRSVRNIDKIKNEEKKVVRRDSKITDLERDVSSKSRHLKDLSRSLRSLEYETASLQGKYENELLEKKNIIEVLSSQRDAAVLKQDAATNKLDLTRTILTANPNSKSSRFNVYSLLFSAKIVCSFIVLY
jgi:hypothetical protein